MSEQYAFAIGFDREPEETSDRPDDDWMRVIEQVSAAIVQANLPPIGSTRWDEFGQGYVFWGTEAECAAVRQALSSFDLYIEEDRNLDQGYYATADHTYYVDGEGQIYRLADHSVHQDAPLETIESIPLDAYRSRSIDSELDAQVQAKIQAQAQAQVPEVVPEVAPEVTPEIAPTTLEVQPDIAQHSNQAESRDASADALSQSAVSDPVTLPGLSDSRVAESPVVSSLAAAESPATGAEDKNITLATYVQQLRQLRQKTAQVSELEVRLRTALVQVEALEGQLERQSQPQALEPQPDLQLQLERIQSELHQATDKNRLLQDQDEQQTARIAELEQALASVQEQIRLAQDKLQQAETSAARLPELEQALNTAQSHSDQKSAQIAELEQAVTAAHEQLQIVQAQDEEKYVRIGELELSIAALQQASDERSSLPTVSLEDHDQVQQKSAAQEAQILELQRQIQRLEQRIQDLSSQSDQKVSLSKYEALEEEVQDKTAIIAELRHILQQQERDLREWQTVAEAKVDWAEHQQLQEELRRLQSRPKRGLFARLFGWLWH